MKRLSRYPILIAVCITCLLSLAGPARATSLTVTPVLLTLDRNHHSIALTIQNRSDEAKVIQTELVRWTQQDGDDMHAPSRDLLVNPPIFTLKPNQRQVVRIGLNRKVDAKELAYRLRLTEVPPPPRAEFSGLRVALRFDIPVYVLPKAAQENLLNWKASRSANGELQLTLGNMSNRHVQVRDIKLNEAMGGCKLADWQPLQFVLLAGQSRRIELKPGVECQGEQIELTAHINEGLIAVKVAPEPTGQGRIAP
jgi:fimbrial chaperone protein